MIMSNYDLNIKSFFAMLWPSPGNPCKLTQQEKRLVEKGGECIT